MRVVDPATGEVLREVAEADRAAVAAAFRRARAAQPAWAATPLAVRSEAIRRFRALAVERAEPLARTLALEVGKPITQARSELAGLLPRIDFFLAEVEAALADEVVLASPADRLEERIRREPLGVVANISAWNYPWYVGANVFLPALLTGNAVLYKPSELATLTGLAIAELLRRRARLRARACLGALRGRVRRDGARLGGRRPARRADLHRPARAARGRARAARGAGGRRGGTRRAGAHWRPLPRPPGFLLRAHRGGGRRSHHARHARGDLRATRRPRARRLRRRGRRAHERHRVRPDGRRLHARPHARRAPARAGEHRYRILELLRPREPPAAVERPGRLGTRGHARARGARHLHTAEGMAPAGRLRLSLRTAPARAAGAARAPRGPARSCRGCACGAPTTPRPARRATPRGRRRPLLYHHPTSRPRSRA